MTTPGFQLSNVGTLAWSSGVNYYNTAAAGFSYISPGVVALGNGTGGDFSGTLKLASVILGSGSGVAGAVDLAAGTLPALGTTSITLMAPAAVTSYGLLYPGTAPSAGQSLVWGAPASGVSTATFQKVVTFTGTAAAANCGGLATGCLVSTALGGTNYIPYY